MAKKSTRMRNMKSDDCCCGNMHDMHHRWHYHTYHKAGGAVYGLGFIGAAIYYISTATGFWMGVLGILKAIVWPAFLVYQALKYMGM